MEWDGGGPPIRVTVLAMGSFLPYQFKAERNQQRFDLSGLQNRDRAQC